MASFCVAATLLLGAVLPCSDALTVGQAGLMSPQTRNPVKLQRLFRQSEGVGEETQKVQPALVETISMHSRLEKEGAGVGAAFSTKVGELLQATTKSEEARVSTSIFSALEHNQKVRSKSKKYCPQPPCPGPEELSWDLAFNPYGYYPCLDCPPLPLNPPIGGNPATWTPTNKAAPANNTDLTQQQQSSFMEASTLQGFKSSTTQGAEPSAPFLREMEAMLLKATTKSKLMRRRVQPLSTTRRNEISALEQKQEVRSKECPQPPCQVEAERLSWDKAINPYGYYPCAQLPCPYYQTPCGYPSCGQRGREPNTWSKTSEGVNPSLPVPSRVLSDLGVECMNGCGR